MGNIKIALYEPADSPTIPEVKIGQAFLSRETWEKVGGVGAYVDHGPMRWFRLALLKPMGPVRSTPDMNAMAEEVMHTIICDSVPIWRNGRNLYEWRAIVPDQADREKVASMDGKWIG